MPQFEDFERNSLKSWNGEVLLLVLSIKAYCYLVKEVISLVFYEEGGSSNNVSGKASFRIIRAMDPVSHTSRKNDGDTRISGLGEL